MRESDTLLHAAAGAVLGLVVAGTIDALADAEADRDLAVACVALGVLGGIVVGAAAELVRHLFDQYDREDRLRRELGRVSADYVSARLEVERLRKPAAPPTGDGG